MLFQVERTKIVKSKMSYKKYKQDLVNYQIVQGDLEDFEELEIDVNSAA